MDVGRAPSVLRDGVVLVAAGAAAVVAFVLGPLAFPDYSGNADEPVYVLQATALAEGRLTLDADVHGGPFQPWLTGEHDGRVYTQYQPGWPAVMALADRLGAMRLAIAGAAGGLVIAAAALAEQVFGRRGERRVAALATAATPLFVVHSFTWLAYTFSAAWLIGTAALFVRHARAPRRRTALLGGAMLAAGLLIRPFDAVVVGATLVVALLVVRGRGALPRLVRLAPWATLGALPAVVTALAYNRHVTGHPFHFPLAASSPENRFGFGPREIMPGEPPVDYSVSTAIDAFGRGVSSVPSWTALGALAVVAGVVALLDRRIPWRGRVALAMAVAVFPVAYLFWWATALAAQGTRNGLGPHYYLPSVVVLTVLAARGLVVLVERSGVDPRVATLRIVVLGAALMAYNLGDKVSDVQATADARARSADLAMPADNAVVILPSDQRYVLAQNPVLANEPTPEPDDVVFAVDDGALNSDARRVAERTVMRLTNVWYPGDGLFSPSLELVPVRYLMADELCVSLAEGSEGRLILGWDISFFVDVTDRPVHLDRAARGALPLFFVPDDPTVEWARAILPYGPAAEPDMVEIEVPSIVQKGVRFPETTAWLATTEVERLPVDITPGPCP